MSEQDLRIVLSFDDKTKRYKADAHNVPAEEAVGRVKNPADVTAVIIQKERHRAANVKRCKPCKQAAEDFQKRLREGVTKLAEEIQAGQPPADTNDEADHE